MPDQFPSAAWLPRRQTWWDWLPRTQPNPFAPPRSSIDPGASLSGQQTDNTGLRSVPPWLRLVIPKISNDVSPSLQNRGAAEDEDSSSWPGSDTVSGTGRGILGQFDQWGSASNPNATYPFASPSPGGGILAPLIE